jgi:hypothetical protein
MANERRRGRLEYAAGLRATDGREGALEHVVGELIVQEVFCQPYAGKDTVSRRRG